MMGSLPCLLSAADALAGTGVLSTGATSLLGARSKAAELFQAQPH